MLNAVDPPRRFYEHAAAGPAEGGHGVLLDGRPVRSPGGTLLALPAQALAGMIAAEWEAQSPKILLARMPATRLAFTAVDRVAAARAETEAELVRYAANDLVCYRADGPGVLVERQAAAWDPILAWADETFGLRLEIAAGIIHQAQPDESLQAMARLAKAADAFALAGLVYAAGLLGSAVLALALWRGRLGADQAFDLSRLDEDFQEQQWGVDAEAAHRAAQRRAEAQMVGGWFTALRE